MLKERSITGAGLTCAIAAVLLLSGHIWFLKAVSVILSVMAAWELCRAGGYLQQKAFLWGTLTAAAFFALFGTAAPVGMVLLLALTAAVFLICQVQNLTKLTKAIILLTASASAYFFGLFASLREQAQGFWLLSMVILIPVLTDVGAFSLGTRFGKHKLAPIVSPHKTWEGSVGGTACAVALLAAAAWILRRSGIVSVRMPYLTVYLLIASCLSQLGDLTFSAIKRIAGIKDYGTLLPGHGGILDRFDSLVFVIPFTLFVTRCFGPLVS